MTQITDPNGSVIADTYDDNNRRTARSITRGAGVLGTTSETFTYDGLGRMTKAEDNDYKVEFTYGVIGLSSQVYEEKQSYVGGSAYTKTVTRTWDAAGNKITELYPSGLDLDYAWNDINRLSSVSDGTNTIASYTYVGLRREKVTFQNSTSASYTYTGFRGEVERIHHETSGPATIVDIQYGYDDNHDRTYERFGGGAAAGDAFEYDMARRLTTAYVGSTDVTAPSSNSYTKKIVYAMDDDGNRSSVAVTPYGSSTTTTNYTDNSLNQYTAVGGTSRSHDDNGNLIDDGTLDYEYDYHNQIVRIKQGANTVGEYKYDALGRRVEKDDGTDVRRFIYSSAETVAVYDGSNVWVQDFVYGDVIDEVLMLEQADVLDFDSDANTTETTRSFYHRNALGSVMAITDMNEAEVVSYSYDPYGAVTITRNSTTQSSDPLGNPWMYTGRFTDEETGLYYYRARNYSPVTGRFLQRDPLGYTPGASLYEYVAGRVTGRRDPLGLYPTVSREDVAEARDAYDDLVRQEDAILNQIQAAEDKAKVYWALRTGRDETALDTPQQRMLFRQYRDSPTQWISSSGDGLSDDKKKELENLEREMDALAEQLFDDYINGGLLGRLSKALKRHDLLVDLYNLQTWERRNRVGRDDEPTLAGRGAEPGYLPFAEGGEWPLPPVWGTDEAREIKRMKDCVEHGLVKR